MQPHELRRLLQRQGRLRPGPDRGLVRHQRRCLLLLQLGTDVHERRMRRGLWRVSRPDRYVPGREHRRRLWDQWRRLSKLQQRRVVPERNLHRKLRLDQLPERLLQRGHVRGLCQPDSDPVRSGRRGMRPMPRLRYVRHIGRHLSGLGDVRRRQLHRVLQWEHLRDQHQHQSVRAEWRQLPSLYRESAVQQRCLHDRDVHQLSERLLQLERHVHLVAQPK
jgi:hypothetical protein